MKNVNSNDNYQNKSSYNVNEYNVNDEETCLATRSRHKSWYLDNGCLWHVMLKYDSKKLDGWVGGTVFLGN